MDDSEGQTLLDVVCDGLLETDEELNDAALPQDAPVGDLAESKPRFQCQDCNKSYTTKKSLLRHLSSLGNKCANERLTHGQTTVRPPRPRWACSRCGKDCATNASVERHIGNSCWRTCDECVVDRNTRCDSLNKNGPCRACEGKGLPCTKHTSAVPGAKSVRWIGSKAPSQLQSTVDDEDASTSEHELAKRKKGTSPKTSPERAHRDKRSALADHQVIDYGEGRMIDPLGGQAHVPPKFKEEAVSDWLDGQSNKSASAVSTHAQMQDDRSHLNQCESMQALHFDHQQSDRLLNQTHASGGALSSPAAFLPSQQRSRNPTPNYQQHLLFPPINQGHGTIDYGAASTPELADLTHPSLFGGLPSMKVGKPIQYDQMYFQMQILRQQNRAHDLEMARQCSAHDGTGLPLAPPPFGASGPLNQGPQGFIQTQGHSGMSSLQAPNVGYIDPVDPVLMLQIHSNTHDKNGQPIFSILRMRANERFGPRLDAYCADRGKEYGIDWMFVYRYQTGTHQNPEHDMQITLTWDMTPTDVKSDDVPGLTMRNMDTIYVMKAMKPATAGTKRELSEGGAVQSPGSQISHQIVDITNGETRYFQNPDVTRQWSEAVHKDNAQLRALHHQMQTVIMQLREELLAKNQQNRDLNMHMAELTKMSKEYREMVQRRTGNANANAPGPGPEVAQFALSHLPSGCVARQCPVPLDPSVQQHPPRQPASKTAEYYKQQAAQQRTNNDFIKKCEAVREPKEQAPQQLQPLLFPSFESGSTVSDFSNELSMGLMFDGQVQDDGRFFDALDNVVADNGSKEMAEE